MDPQATLNELLLAAFRGDADEARDLLAALLDWRAKGGFMPDVGQALAKIEEHIGRPRRFT